MTRAEYEALRLEAFGVQTGLRDGEPIIGLTASWRYAVERTRREAWLSTYNAALTGLALADIAEDSPSFPSLEAAVAETKRICTAHADALHGSIE